MVPMHWNPNQSSRNLFRTLQKNNRFIHELNQKLKLVQLILNWLKIKKKINWMILIITKKEGLLIKWNLIKINKLDFKGNSKSKYR